MEESRERMTTRFHQVFLASLAASAAALAMATAFIVHETRSDELTAIELRLRDQAHHRGLLARNDSSPRISRSTGSRPAGPASSGAASRCRARRARAR
jgi:hypothetical protein